MSSGWHVTGDGTVNEKARFLHMANALSEIGHVMSDLRVVAKSKGVSPHYNELVTIQGRLLAMMRETGSEGYRIRLLMEMSEKEVEKHDIARVEVTCDSLHLIRKKSANLVTFDESMMLRMIMLASLGSRVAETASAIASEIEARSK